IGHRVARLGLLRRLFSVAQLLPVLILLVLLQSVLSGLLLLRIGLVVGHLLQLLLGVLLRLRVAVLHLVLQLGNVFVAAVAAIGLLIVVGLILRIAAAVVRLIAALVLYKLPGVAHGRLALGLRFAGIFLRLRVVLIALRHLTLR